MTADRLIEYSKESSTESIREHAMHFGKLHFGRFLVILMLVVQKVDLNFIGTGTLTGSDTRDSVSGLCRIFQKFKSVFIMQYRLLIGRGIT